MHISQPDVLRTCDQKTAFHYWNLHEQSSGQKRGKHTQHKESQPRGQTQSHHKRPLQDAADCPDRPPPLPCAQCGHAWGALSPGSLRFVLNFLDSMTLPYSAILHWSGVCSACSGFLKLLLYAVAARIRPQYGTGVWSIELSMLPLVVVSHIAC